MPSDYQKLVSVVNDSLKDAYKKQEAEHKQELWLTWVSQDKEGRVTDVFTKPSDSYVRQFLHILYVNMSDGTLSIANTAGTGISSSDSSSAWIMNAGVGITTHGIRVGTGTTAVTVNDANISAGSIIAHGTSSGQLSHGAVLVATNVTVSSPDTTFTIARGFTNSSGGAITVNEVALYAEYIATPFYACIVRDLSTVTINNSSTSTCTYTLKTTA